MICNLFNTTGHGLAEQQEQVSSKPRPGHSKRRLRYTRMVGYIADRMLEIGEMIKLARATNGRFDEAAVQRGLAI